jgi:integrase
MGRPPTPVGTYGRIKTKRVAPKTWEAFTRFRMVDGAYKPVGRRGPTKTAAEDRLKEALRDMADEIRSQEIKSETRMARICDLWIADFAESQRLNKKSPTTAETYERYIRLWIKPAIGQLQARELRAFACDRLVKKALEKSYPTAASVKSVLSSVCGYAVRFGAMDANPVKSLAQLTRQEQREVKAMTREQRDDLLERLEAFAVERAADKRGRSLGTRADVWRQLPDLVRAMLATGVRLGELLALDGDDVDTMTQTVHIRHHIVRQKGAGLLRFPGRKGRQPPLLLAVPNWSVPMWGRLAARGGPLFPSGTGGWLDPRNTNKRIRLAMNECGFDWVTAHVWRKTVSHVLDEAGLSNNAIADQLGNTPEVVERHYRPKRIANAASAAALESMFDDDGEAE